MANFNIRVRVVQSQSIDFTPEGGTRINMEKIHCLGSTPINENGRRGLPVEVYKAEPGFASRNLPTIPGDYTLTVELINNGGKLSQKVLKAEKVNEVPPVPASPIK